MPGFLWTWPLIMASKRYNTPSFRCAFEQWRVVARWSAAKHLLGTRVRCKCGTRQRTNSHVDSTYVSSLDTPTFLWTSPLMASKRDNTPSFRCAFEQWRVVARRARCQLGLFWQPRQCVGAALSAIGRLMRKATNHTVQDINASEEDPIVGQGPI